MKHAFNHSGVIAVLSASLWFSAQGMAHAESTECLGYPNDGHLKHPARLHPRRYLRVREKSRPNSWAHPALLQILDRGAKALAVHSPESVLLVGDLSAEEGGPLRGHVSHQVGRDADIAFWVTNEAGKPGRTARFTPLDSKGRGTADKRLRFDLARNWVMLRAWMDYLRVPVRAVFISSGLRKLMLQYGQQQPELTAYVPLARRLLKPHAKHNDHFHLRIGCPPDQGSRCHEDSRRK